MRPTWTGTRLSAVGTQVGTADTVPYRLDYRLRTGLVLFTDSGQPHSSNGICRRIGSRPVEDRLRHGRVGIRRTRAGAVDRRRAADRLVHRPLVGVDRDDEHSPGAGKDVRQERTPGR